MSFWFDDSKTQRAWDQCHRQTLKENLSPYFGVFGIFEGTLSRRQTGQSAGPSLGGGSNCPSAPVDPKPPSVLRVRADCAGRFFTAKLGVVVHGSAASTVRSLAGG